MAIGEAYRNQYTTLDARRAKTARTKPCAACGVPIKTQGGKKNCSCCSNKILEARSRIHARNYARRKRAERLDQQTIMTKEVTRHE